MALWSAQAWDRGLRNYLGAPSVATSAFTESSGDQVCLPTLDPQQDSLHGALLHHHAKSVQASEPARNLRSYSRDR